MTETLPSSEKPNAPARDDEIGLGEKELSLWFKLLLLSLIWVLIGALFALQIIAVEQIPGSFALRMAVMDWGPWILLSPAVLWLSRRIQITADTWKWALPLHLVTSIALAIVVELIVFAHLGNRFEREGRPPPDFARDLRREQGSPPRVGPPLRMIHARFNIPIYWVLVAAAHALAFHRRSILKERRALRAEAQLAEARLAALQSQINPHFLFNALNAIAQYVHEDPLLAEKMINALGSLLHLVLKASDRRELSLKEELVFIDHYLSIQKLRFPDRLSVLYEVDDEALEARVPTLILQPSVENAIIHGIARSRTPGVLKIRAMAKNGRLLLQIVDTGAGLPGTKPISGQPVVIREGMGVGNTRARLENTFGRDFSFSHVHAPEGGLCVNMEIPLLPADFPVEKA